jgi:prophage antirepressor-like protein
MNNQLIPFTFENRQTRIIVEGDELWFVVQDVVRALDYLDSSNPAKLCKNVPEEWKGVKPFHTPGGMQNMLCLSEQGLYFFLGRSDKPKALPFQKKVAGDILPQIRKTGTYGVNAGELTALRESLMLAKSERDTYKRLWLAERKIVLRFENRNFLTWEDKREILSLLINKYPLAKIQRITKKSYDRIKTFRDDLIHMNDEALEQFLTMVKSAGRETPQRHDGGVA